MCQINTLYTLYLRNIEGFLSISLNTIGFVLAVELFAKFGPLVACIYVLVGGFIGAFRLDPIWATYWGNISLKFHCDSPSVRYCFHSSWWKHKLFPTLCKLQGWFCLFVSSGSFSSLRSFLTHVCWLQLKNLWGNTTELWSSHSLGAVLSSPVICPTNLSHLESFIL